MDELRLRNSVAGNTLYRERPDANTPAGLRLEEDKQLPKPYRRLIIPGAVPHWVDVNARDILRREKALIYDIGGYEYVYGGGEKQERERSVLQVVPPTVWGKEISPEGKRSNITMTFSERSEDSLLVFPRDSTTAGHPTNMTDYSDIRAYLYRGEFGNALTLCNKALRPNERISFVDRARIEIQIAIIHLLRGSYADYVDATARLEALEQQCRLPKAHDVNLPSVHAELVLWLARSFMQSGRYDDAELKLLQALPGSPKLEKLQELERGKLHVLSVWRDQALLHCYLGRFTRAKKEITDLRNHIKSLVDQEQTRVQREQGRSERYNGLADTTARTRSLQRKSASILIAAATIHNIVGDYAAALTMVDEAWGSLAQGLGTRHIKTLEAACLRAHLLPLTSHVREAETFCMETWKTIVSELGDYHPLALNAARTVVTILRQQSRIIEAVDTSMSVYLKTKESLTDVHPQTMAAKAEWASSLAASGDYKGASEIYLELLEQMPNLSL
ncbi:hypothetical protein QBC41DRAFT_351062 [Cercophora samala]|uniref:Uncharacterized protein n=1 Tax=Cercophora samala TaxID=330535 RepID=A0AA40D1R2_9PEZI|nr:hypothetical protein QBC41DRAFT_351062 [Cercophora samala]